MSISLAPVETGSYTGYSTHPIIDAFPHESKSATPTRLTLTNNVNHCSKIIQALQVQDRSTELQTFDNVTPEDFECILDKRSNWIYPKLYYNARLLRLTAMAPTAIHERAIQSFRDCMTTLTAPYKTGRIRFLHLPNSLVEGDEKCIIPDLRLDLAPRYKPGEEPVTIWVGECGLSQTREDMEQKLAQAIRNAPTIDAVFMLNICEVKTPRNPNRSFAAQPRHSFSSFTSPFETLPLAKLSPVVVGGVTWANIKSIELMVFIRADDGKFDFKIHDGNPFAACGLLHPSISVEHVTMLLDIAARRLHTTIADIMESHHDDDHSRIHALRNAADTVTFPIEWDDFLADIQGALYSTAFSRYQKWFNENH